MKKLVSVVLALSLLFLLGACTGGGETDTTTPIKTGAPLRTTTTEAEKVQDAKVGFIFLHDENSTYDLNFINAAKAACEELGVEYVLKTNIAEDSACYEAACDLADQGCNLVFADSFNHESYMIQAAKEYPDVEFCHATGTRAHTEGLKNFHNAFANIFEGRYVAGYAAGMKIAEMIANGETVNGTKVTEETAKMGYVGAYTYAEVISGYTAFFLGAQAACPSVTMEVQFTGSWYDEALEKEACEKLLGDKCILISQHADSMGAPTACEAAGVPNVSYNGSTMDACPNTYLISSRIDWTPYFKYIIKAVESKTEIKTDWVGTFNDGSVALTDLNTAIAAKGTQEKLNSIMSGFRNGSKHAFQTSTFKVNGESLRTYKADVDTDAEYTPDTEVIRSGYFWESYYRSAPYFDIRIDGITLLNEEF